MKLSPITFASDKLTLEGILQLPEEDNLVAAMLVCHPHPLYGGDMNNNIVLALCRAAASARMASLRFNFRGVGLSEGTHTGGQGETEDIRAALHYMQSHPRIDKSIITVAGYSFGANAVLNAVYTNANINYLILVGCSWSMLANYMDNNSTRPTLVIQGEQDNIVKREDFHYVRPGSGSLIELRTVARADHFFRGHEKAVCGHATDFLNRWVK